MPRSCPSHLPPQHFSNIDQDTRCSDELREDCISHLGAATSPTDAENKFSDWSASIVAAGKLPLHAVTFDSDERVGRLRYRDTFALEIAKRLSADPAVGGVDVTDIEELVRWIFGEPATIDPAAAQYLFATFLADRPIEENGGWYFRVAGHTGSPFSADKDCLPWRLGMRFVASGSRYIGMNILGSSLANARSPVFIDVPWAFQPFWRPNGFTQPLADTPASCDNTGLEEVLANAPRFSDLQRPPETITAR